MPSFHNPVVIFWYGSKNYTWELGMRIKQAVEISVGNYNHKVNNLSIQEKIDNWIFKNFISLELHNAFLLFL